MESSLSVWGGKKVNRMKSVLLSLMAFAPILLLLNPQIVDAQMETMKSVLLSYGIQGPEIELSENSVVISYSRKISKIGGLEEELRRIARILVVVSDQFSEDCGVFIRQFFDNGQILGIEARSSDGKLFLNGAISKEAFWLERLRFKWITRGPPIIEGVCDPNKGNNCKNCEACACYPNEMCAPSSLKANRRGCVAKYIPNNAHLLGSEYVCNKGYEWNRDLTGCVAEKKCPENAFRFQGDCYCDPGFEASADGANCTRVGGGASVHISDIKPVSTAPKPISNRPAGSIIRQALLLEGVPPSPWNQKNVFSPGDSIYIWVEIKILNSPHTLEIVWSDPKGTEAKREQFDLRGWGASEIHWSELKTSAATLQGQWNINLLVDGKVERAVAFSFQP